MSYINNQIVFRTLLSILTISIFISCNLTSGYDYIKQGHDLGMQGNYKKAILSYTKAIEKNPKLKEAYIQKGLCYEYLDEVDTAISIYEQLLKFDRNNTTAFYYIGICKYKQNKFLEAIDFYNSALISTGIRNPNDTSNAQIFLTLNKDLMTAEQAASYIPSYEIFYERGLAFYSNQQIKRAYLDFHNCISQKYNLGESNYMIGLCWLKANNKINACDAFREAVMYGDSLSKIQFLKECR